MIDNNDKHTDNDKLILREKRVSSILDKLFPESNPSATLSQIARGRDLYGLALELYDFIEPVCWRTEANLSCELERSPRQIKYAKALLERLELIEIDVKPNGRRSNSKHVMRKVAGNRKQLESKDNLFVPEIQWSFFDENTANFVNSLTIEQTLDLYEEMRFRFIPLHFPIFEEAGELSCSCGEATCNKIGKHPVRTVKNLDFSKPATYRKVRGYWNKKRFPYSQYNLGILTDNFSVIDVDRRHGGHYSFEDLEEEFGEIPRGLSVETGNGTHFYTSSRLKNCTNALKFRGIDIRAEGLYIIAPPSLHKSGKRYSWLSISEPSMVSNSLLEALTEETAIGGTTSADRYAWNPYSTDPIADGQRNDVLFRAASSVRGKGGDYYAIYEHIGSLNRSRCTNPLPDAEIKSIAKSAYRYQVNAEKELALKP